MRQYHDLLAYGQHFPTCLLREKVERHGHRPPLRPHDCSCGYTKALEDARAAQHASLATKGERDG